MTTIVRASDVEAALRLEGKMTAKDRSVVNDVIAPSVQGEARIYINRPLELRAVIGELHVLDTPGVDAAGQIVVRLDQGPVASIEQIVSTPWLDPTGPTYVIPAQWYLVEPWGAAIQLGWPGGFPARLTVDYHAGLDLDADEMAGLRSILLRRTCREYINGLVAQSQAGTANIGLASLAVEGYSVSFRDPEVGTTTATARDVESVGGFTGSEIRMLKRFRRRVIL